MSVNILTLPLIYLKSLHFCRRLGKNKEKPLSRELKVNICNAFIFYYWFLGFDTSFQFNKYFKVLKTAYLIVIIVFV